jgi:hypothetical protein
LTDANAAPGVPDKVREMFYFTFVMLIEQGKKRIGPYRSKPSNYSILK